MPRWQLRCIYALAFAASALVLFCIFLDCLGANYWRNSSPLFSSIFGHDYWRTAGPFLGAMLVATGWVVTSENTVKNAQRQQTIAFILRSEFDAVTEGHRATIRRFLPSDLDKLTDSPCRFPSFSEHTAPLYQAINYVLNTFEFVSVGVRNEDLNEDMLKRAYLNRFLRFRDTVTDYIEFWQNRIGPTTWSEYVALCDKWQSEKDHDALTKKLTDRMRAAMPIGTTQLP